MADWQKIIKEEKAKPYFAKLEAKIQQAREQNQIIYPAPEHIFQAFHLTPFDNVKVVILGQDPYHGPNQAHGLAFSVQPGIKTPPSLVNMYKTLAKEYSDFIIPEHGYLSAWAEQGVLLLNTVLTVEDGKAHSHAKWGWETFTDRMIHELNEQKEHLVFLLWGAHAQKKGQFIDRQKHCVLTAPHPSPLSAHRGFFDCQHFTKANEYLVQHQQTPINWQLPLNVEIV